MSGSRRNRILDLNASTALPNHHTLQSQALAPYQYPVPATNNHNASSAARPTVIQYAIPQHPPGHVQTRPQHAPQIPSPTRALPPPPTHTRVTPTTDFAMERLAQSIVAAITPTLTDHEKSVAATIKKVEETVENFAKDVNEARTATDKWLLQLTEAMQKSLHMQQAQAKAANKRMEKVEALILAGFDRNDEMSLVSRLENIQYTVGELSERVKDPGAQDLIMASQLARKTVNGVEVQAFPSPPESIEGRAPTPIQRIYEDRSTSCDIPEPLPERPQSPVRPLYKDAASDVVDLESEPPIMTSPVLPEYKDAGNNPRSPSPPRRLQRMSRSSSFERPPGSDSESDYPRWSAYSFRGKSSQVTTEFDESSCNETETPVDAEEANVDLRSHINSFSNLEDNTFMTDSEGDELMIDVDKNIHYNWPDVESQPQLVKISTDDEVHDHVQMDYDRENDFAAPTIAVTPSRPHTPIEDSAAALVQMDESDSVAPALVDPIIPSRSPILIKDSIAALADSVAPAIAEYKSITPSRSPRSAEGNVAALRETLFSSREASADPPPQEQYSLPSPNTTSSAPASHKRKHSPLPAIFVPATMSPSQPTQQRPVFTISSPTSHSKSDVSPLIARVDRAESISIPVSTPPPPGSAPPPKNNVTPNSDDGSEISVSRMVTVQTSDSPENPRLFGPATTVLEHVEQPQAQALPPPFLLSELRSQSPSSRHDDVPPESSRLFLESPPPSPKCTHQTPSKSQSVRPMMPVVESTSLTRPPATIFNTPYNKLKRKNSDRSIISIKSTPQKIPKIMRPVVVRSTRPPATPRPTSVSEKIVVHSSPIFVPSRSLSPLSVLDSVSEAELSDAGSDVVRVIRKKSKEGASSNSKSQTESGTSAGASTSMSASAGSGSGSVSNRGTRRINLLQKLQVKKGESAALTRVRKRKAPTAEQMEPPLKRARKKAAVSAAVEVEREIRVKPERMSVGLSSVHAGGRGKGRWKEREKEDEKGYKLASNKTKTSPVKDDKKLRPRAPPVGANWPQKNVSGDNKFDNQFIECEKCYLWYHYGCIGIMDSNDPIAIGEKTFICPPCTGGGASTYCPVMR
ncbi:hypothetical protein H2248_011958 [Termitomyces sp. 'cryptogamus']|nr:hypothetical protein H2248_011958 [Termitomyces sp. 'cryptogamus']